MNAADHTQTSEQHSAVPLHRGLDYWSERLGLSSKTLRRAIAAGHLDHVRVGSRIILSDAAVARWLEKKTRQGRAA